MLREKEENFYSGKGSVSKKVQEERQLEVDNYWKIGKKCLGCADWFVKERREPEGGKGPDLLEVL
jgi:hypothetical protein